MRHHTRTVSLRFPTASTRPSAESRIGDLIEVQDNGCWVFKGEADDYGEAWIAGTRVVVHRWVYTTLTGVNVPDDWHLHHRCETKGCCNPEHLLPVSPADHVSIHRGDYQSMTDRILELRAQGWTLRGIAAEMGCSTSHVHRIVRGHR